MDGRDMTGDERAAIARVVGLMANDHLLMAACRRDANGGNAGELFTRCRRELDDIQLRMGEHDVSVTPRVISDRLARHGSGEMRQIELDLHTLRCDMQQQISMLRTEVDALRADFEKLRRKQAEPVLLRLGENPAVMFVPE